MIPFDLEKAKAGKPVITKTGKSVRIICFDRQMYNKSAPIIALIMSNSRKHEMLAQYDLNGIQINNDSNLNLYMKDE